MKGHFIKTGHKSTLPTSPHSSGLFTPLSLPLVIACPYIIYIKVLTGLSQYILSFKYQVLCAFVSTMSQKRLHVCTDRLKKKVGVSGKEFVVMTER